MINKLYLMTKTKFVNRSKNLNTCNDVVNLVRDIYAYSENEDFDKELEKEMKQEISMIKVIKKNKTISISERLSDDYPTRKSGNYHLDLIMIQEDEQSSASDSKEEEERRRK